MRLFGWLKKIVLFGGKKKTYQLYLGQDQMALAGRLAERVGRPLHELVGESLSYMFTELSLPCKELEREAARFHKRSL